VEKNILNFATFLTPNFRDVPFLRYTLEYIVIRMDVRIFTDFIDLYGFFLFFCLGFEHEF
jgi:hypothetical protein